jgi:hypothetical protein
MRRDFPRNISSAVRADVARSAAVAATALVPLKNTRLDIVMAFP